MKIRPAIWCLGLFIFTVQQFLVTTSQASNFKKRNSEGQLTQNQTQFLKSELHVTAIQNCPREFSNWSLIESFTTKSFSLALCQQEDLLYLVGHQQQQHENFVSAKIIYQRNNLLIAEDEDGFSFEISNYELKVFQDNKLIAQENLLQPELTKMIWQLQEIHYNNDKLIEVANPANYTIEFLSDGQVSIKADCNRARGTYTQEGNSISIKIGPTTLAMCDPESISEQYLQELQAATILFFQDGNLYFDLKFDTGTMKFTPKTFGNDSV